MSYTIASPKGWLNFVYVAIAGAIYPLGFSPLEWWPLPIFSVAVLWWLLQDKSPKEAFWTGFCYGMGLFAVGVSWLYVSINTFGHAAPWLATLLTILAIAFLSLFFAFLAWIQRKLLSQYGRLSQMILFALMWLLVDLIRGSGFWNFPWLYLGYSQTSGPLMGLATYVGVHGLTLVLVFIALLVSELIFRQRNNAAVSLKLACILVIAMGLSLLPFTNITNKISVTETVTVALIQPNVDQHQKWDRKYFGPIINGLIEQTEPYWGADYVIWPEAAIPAMDTQVSLLLNQLESKAKNYHSQFITGIPIYEDREHYYPGIKLLGDHKGEYRKQKLVPFGEYLPFESLLRDVIDFFNLPMSSFSAGSSSQTPLSTEKANLIPAICYEVAFSGLIQQLTEKASDDKLKVILTISNDTWFGTSWGPIQHFQIARMRAIENGVPVIRATNNGLTAVVNFNGRVLDEEPRFEQAVLAGVFTLSNRDTWFAQYGYWTLWALSFLLVVVAFGLRHKE